MSRATMEYMTAKAVDLQAKSTEAFKIAIGKNPEKVRALLNLWFVPDFKPTFYDDAAREAVWSLSSGLEDIELLDPSYTSAIAEPGGQEVRYPVRMIDIDTGNLVEYPEIGVHGQYCILSHSWKGREVNYKYLTDAVYKAHAQVFTAAQTANAPIETTRKTDMEILSIQARTDLGEQEQRIERLARECGALAPRLGSSGSDDIVEYLLALRVDVQILENGEDGNGGLQKAKKRLATAIATRDYEKMEGEVFKTLLQGDMGLSQETVKNILDEDQSADEKFPSPDDEVTQAQAVLDEEMKKRAAHAEKLDFFQRHGHLREAVDDLIGCVQRWKSTIKVSKAIERSREIFGRNLFPRTEKRYLWVDSCCINRADDGEYAKSISAMGEWYKNAEFCLIHLDTERDIPAHALEDWRLFKSGASPPHSNIDSFGAILDYGPQWSTRAWTLQELVMSKTTFYANSNWDMLSRPVEMLGAWYYLVPFISLYTNFDTRNPYQLALNDAIGMTSVASSLSESGDEQTDKSSIGNRRIGTAWNLVRILETLGVRAPREINVQTARSWITQSIYVAVSSLTSSNSTANSSGRQVLDKILETLAPYSQEENLSYEERARHAINIILKGIVVLTEGDIADDRRYIASFGKVPYLNSWLGGLSTSNFSTHKVMSLVCSRQATVETDKAYCQMGMLGVRFPTFHAEGLTKALSRLLDEVVITANDVSVFNWTGRQYGSPIRGRSLYPSSPEAYKFSRDESRKKQKDKKLAEILQIERYEVMSDFLAIQGMLLEVTAFAKDRQQKNIPLLWVMEIIRVIKRRPFDKLKPHIENIGKILKYIQTAFDSKSALASPTDSAGPTSPSADGASSKQGLYSLSTPSLASLQSQVKIPSLPIGVPSFQAPSLGRKQTTEAEKPAATPTTQPPSKRGFKGFKAPSIKSFTSKDAGSAVSPSSPPAPETPTATDAASSLSPPATPSVIHSSSTKHSLEDDVLSYIRSIEAQDQTGPSTADSKTPQLPKLPAELEKVLADIPSRDFSKTAPKAEEIETMISPNPIIVKNSGIEGSFDIQRVVVSMVQPEKLRRRIRGAATADQKVSGWCTISTGFAVVIVGFSCPRGILDRQMDVVQSVERKVLNKEMGDKEGEGQGEESEVEAGEGEDHDPTGMGVEEGTRKSARPKTLSRLQSRISSLQESSEKAESADLPEGPELEPLKAEGSRVSRMIKFVQEPKLSSVAGEWVLARLSGVPGAKWFLCYLELGSSGRDFYGHRIATDEIDFRDASPEMGLVRYWEYYMMQKKHMLCSILQKLVESRDWGRLRDQVGEKLGGRVVEEAKNRGYLDFVEAEKADSVGKEVNASAMDNDGNGSDEEEAGEMSGLLKELGGMALTVAGAGLIQKFYEWRAERLQKNLSAEVLKKFPTHMQAALESLDDNKDLMPSMFHSARKIHMF
ncbi:hypothetical protein F4778DRAFT_683566 [Xylariomycetidae sp. FL2044]|nr:hypothetical protein F4778DRAFT_683566 [Xylariomycetidae sp. FL2044]